MPTAVQRGFVSEDLYKQFLKDADLLKSEGLIADEDYNKIVSGSYEEAQDALSRSFGATDKARSKLLKIGDVDEFSEVVETPSGLVFGFAKQSVKPPEIEIPELKPIDTSGLIVPSLPKPPTLVKEPKPISTAGFAFAQEPQVPEAPKKPVPIPRTPRPVAPQMVVKEAQKQAFEAVKKTRSLEGPDVRERMGEILEDVVVPARTADKKVAIPTPSILGPFGRQEIFTKEESEAIDKQGGFGSVLKNFMTTETEEGKIIESVPAWGLRLLGTLPEVGIGFVEGLVGEKGIGEAVSERIAKGRGLAGAGTDLADATIGYFGLDPQSPEAAVLKEGAFGLGLVFDFLVPLDLGLGDAYRIARTTQEINRLARGEGELSAIVKQLQEAKPDIIEGVKETLVGGVKRTFDPLSKKPTTRQRFVDDVLTKYSVNPENVANAKLAFKGVRDEPFKATAKALGIPTKQSDDFIKVFDTAVADVLEATKGNVDLRAGVAEVFKDTLKSAEDLDASQLSGVIANMDEGLKGIKKVATADDIAKAEELLAQSFLKFSGKRQLLTMSELLSDGTRAIKIGDYTIPLKDAKKISTETKDFFANVDAVKQVREAQKAGKTPVIKMDEGLATKLKEEVPELEDLVKTEYSVPEYNELLSRFYYNKLSKSGASVLTETATAGQKAGKTAKEATAERSIRQGKGVFATIEAFQKKITGPDGFLKSVGDEFRNLFGVSLKKYAGEELLTPAQREALKANKARIASIPSKFQFDIRQGIKAGKTRAQASADAVVNGYKNPNEIFDDFVSTIYGAEERLVETRQTLTGDEVITKGRINPKKGAEAVIALSDDADTILGRAKQEFVSLLKEGKNKEAIEFLGKLHRYLEGKSISTIDPKSFDRLGEAVEILKDAEPVITADKFLPSLFYTYANRQARDIVLDVVKKGIPVETTLETKQLLLGFENALKAVMGDKEKRIMKLLQEDPAFRSAVATDIRALANLDDPAELVATANKYLVDKFQLKETLPDLSKFSAKQNVPGIKKTDIDAFMKTPEFFEAIKNIRLFDADAVAGTLARVVADKFVVGDVYKQLVKQAGRDKARAIGLEIQTKTLTPARLAEIKKEYGDAVASYAGLRQQLKNVLKDTAEAFVKQNQQNRKNNPSLVLKDMFYNAYQRLFRNIPTQTLPETFVLGKSAEDIAYEFSKASPTKVYLDTLAMGLEGTGTKITKPLKDLMRNTRTDAYILSQLEKSRELRRAGETFDYLRKIPKTDIDPSVIKGIGADYTLEEFLKEIKDISLTPHQKSVIARAFEPGVVDRGLGGAENIIKQGLLAGAWVPNFVNHATNALTAGFIISATLGPKRALSATGRFFDGFVGNTLGELFGSKYASILPGKSILETPSGKVYTPRDIAEIVANNNISQTKDALTLSQDLIKDFVRWSGKTEAGADVGKTKEFLRKWLPTNANILTEAATWVDTRFRTAVLTDALRAGKTEQQAIEEARNALFDYSKVSDFEKDYISRVAYFWSFERSALSQAVKNMLVNPKRLFIEEKARTAFAGEEQKSASDDYNKNRIFLGLMNDEATKNRYAVYGPPIPQGEALSKVADYLAFLPPLFYGDVKTSGENVFGAAVSRVSAFPVLSIFLSAGNKEIVFGDLSEPTNYIDPRIFAVLVASPYALQAFNSVVELEEVPEQYRTPEMITQDGKAYRIRKEDATSKYIYNGLLELAKTIGVERALRDYAPMFVDEREGEYVPYSLDVENQFIEGLRDFGLLKLSREKSAEEQMSSLRQQQIREIEEK